MKPNDLKQSFIKLRAEGKSYSAIAAQLHLSKTTCTKWERDFSEEISELKRASLKELYESYGMAKEARIKELGETLKKINAAIDKADFSDVDPAKLLDYKLKYTDALKSEYIENSQPVNSKTLSADEILKAAAGLFNRVQQGELTAEQAQRENTILATLLKAYDLNEVQVKINKLEAIVGGRQ